MTQRVAQGPVDPREVIVLAGGEDADLPLLAPAADATVIAADGGLRLAARLGLDADIVAGDLDSVDADDLEAARAAGALVDTHPVDKDRTDLAIALDLALGYAPARVTVVGGHGGRLDHHLANLLLLGSDAYRDLTITAHMGPAHVTVVRGERQLEGERGALMSLVPVNGPAHGVSTQGLRFPLHDEDLHAGSSRGVSNEFDDDHASVRVREGVLLAIRPGLV